MFHCAQETLCLKKNKFLSLLFKGVFDNVCLIDLALSYINCNETDCCTVCAIVITDALIPHEKSFVLSSFFNIVHYQLIYDTINNKVIV